MEVFRPMSRTRAGLPHKQGLLILGPAEDFRDHRAGDIESLDHEIVQVGEAVEELPGQDPQAPADVAGRQQKDAESGSARPG